MTSPAPFPTLQSIRSVSHITQAGWPSFFLNQRGMGPRVFDFLTERFLFRDDLIGERYASIPLPDIEGESDCYRDFCGANQPALMDEVDRRKLSNPMSGPNTSGNG